MHGTKSLKTPIVFVKSHISNMNRHTVRTQLPFIITYYTTYQLHVSAITWPPSACTKLTG